MPDQEDLQREIFGGSDDDDLSSEDERPQRSEQTRRRSTQHSPAPQGESEEEEGDGDYRDDDAPRALPSFKKKKVSAGEGGATQARRKRRSRTTARAEEPAEELAPDEPPMTEEERAKMELNKRIDAAARMGRSNRPKKRKKGDEDELDAAADAEVVKIKLAMELAALEDQESNKKGQPAVAKLKILQDVVDVLQKQSLMQSIIDHNLLENVRIWLEPLSDKSLPGLTIQRNLFEALGKMFIDANALKESGLGRIMLFYTKKNKRVTPAIKNQATNLVQTWSRPILKRSASYRDRTLVTADVDPASGKKPIKLSQILAQGRIEDAGRVRRNAVRIPQRAMPAFEIVPKSNVGTSGTNSQQTLIEAERRRAQEARLRQVQRKVALNKQRMSRM